ncbi:MAG TPA: hypothetical protein VEN81_05260 [Planctomycetota bacterium]|nr:hypothetical protein [Planctomycetota bacterium]
MTELPIQGILLRVLSTLEAVPIPYMIMGGFAVRAIGIPRPTYDADLTIEASDETLTRLFKALEKDGFMVPDEFRKGFRDSILDMAKVKVQKFEEQHVWDVDLFLVTTPYQRAAFARRQKVLFLGAGRWMITPEDLVLHKLLANRRKDLLDVEEVLRIQVSLDRDYLRDWAANLKITARLEDMLREAGQV